MQTQTGQEQKWDAVIIGSGMGGMTCAAALAKYGWKVLILEEHYVAGGCTHMFSRKGYHWDVGVHCIGDVEDNDLPGKVIDWLSDGQIEVNSLGQVYDQIFFPGGTKVEVPNSKAEFQKNLNKLFPDETATIEAYFQLIDAGANSGRYYFASRMTPPWLDKLLSPLVARHGKRWWMRTTDEVLRELTPNEKLRTVLTSQWGYYGSTPKHSSFAIHAITTRHFLKGGYYPVGGAKTFADHFLKTVEKAGGAIRLRTGVDKVLLENGKAVGVLLKNGERILCPRVISAAGAKLTVDKLLPEEIKNSTWTQPIKNLKQSPTYLGLYIGFEGDIQKAGATSANQWRYDSWDMERSLWDITDPNSKPPFLYISFPSLKDPKHDPGPQQKHTGELITFVPWEPFEKWQHTRRGYREADYMEFKKTLEKRLLDEYLKVLPELKPHIKYYELSTPLSTVHFIKAPQGAIYGLEPTPERFACDQLKTRTPVPGLYLSGCDVAALGVAGALTGGMLTACSLEPRALPKML